VIAEMRDLALKLELSRDPPTLEELAQQLNDWADDLDRRMHWCENCEELQAENTALQEELMGAVDDFAELEAWRQGKDAWEDYWRERAGGILTRIRREVFGFLGSCALRVSRFCWSHEGGRR